MSSRKRPLTILHLSDIQFGYSCSGKALYEEAKRLASIIIADLKSMQLAYNIVPNVIVVSGDLAETSTPSQYKAARIFLDGLRRAMNISSASVIIVPGNHDISWTLSRRLLAGRRVTDPPDSSIHKALLSRFHKFARESNYATPHSEGRARIHLCRELSTLFLLIDTTLNETHRRGSHYGTFHKTDIQNALKFADENDKDRKLLRIAICHHNPLPEIDGSDCLKDGARLNQALAQSGFALLLHGHIHQSKSFSIAKLGGKSIAMCSTGRTACEEDYYEMWPPTYQLLVTDPSGLSSSYLIARRRSSSQSGSIWFSDPTLTDTQLGIVPFHIGPENPTSKSYVDPISARLEMLTSTTRHGHPLLHSSGIVAQELDFNQIDFSSLIMKASRRIDIVNTYGGSWLNSKLTLLKNVLINRKIDIRICLTNPHTIAGKAAASKHKQNPEQFLAVIDNIKKRLRGIVSENQLKGHIQLYLTSKAIAYTAYRFDNHMLYAPLPISLKWPYGPIPVLVLKRPRNNAHGFAVFAWNDVESLFTNSSRLTYDSA